MTTPTPSIAVTGFGRCGSSMAMSMLVAGGIPPVHGSAEGSWELPNIRYAWATETAGHAVKLLDSVLHYGIPPAAEWRFLWMDRNPVEQALSHVKFTAMILGRNLEPDAAELFARSYDHDRPHALGMLRRAGTVLTLDYDWTLRNPRRAARRIRDTLWPALDVEAAITAVHQRDGRCLPDLDFEAGTKTGTAVTS